MSSYGSPTECWYVGPSHFFYISYFYSFSLFFLFHSLSLSFSLVDRWWFWQRFQSISSDSASLRPITTPLLATTSHWHHPKSEDNNQFLTPKRPGVSDSQPVLLYWLVVNMPRLTHTHLGIRAFGLGTCQISARPTHCMRWSAVRPWPRWRGEKGGVTKWEWKGKIKTRRKKRDKKK